MYILFFCVRMRSSIDVLAYENIIIVERAIFRLISTGGGYQMGKVKTYSYDYEDYEDNGKTAGTMVQEILEDPELPDLEGIIIGSWGGAWEEDCQALIDGFVAYKDKFSHIKKLFIGDMDFEECEVSWIMQGDYGDLWAAMPQLEEITIKGATDLRLGEINLPNLKSFTIICGGLSTDIIQCIQKAKMPLLEKLSLYIGSDSYGFDGDANTIRELLEKSDFPKLRYLGILDSEIQDELAEVVLDSKYMKQIETLDLSYGTLTDKGGELLASKIGDYPNLKKLELEYHFLTEDGEKKLEAAVKKAGKEIHLDDPQKADEYNGEVYYYAMLTE